MSRPDEADFHTGPVIDWLGLGPIVPTGLHGRNRGRLVRRHTQEVGGRFFNEALAHVYPRDREGPLLKLLRPHQLDDALWRMIYAVLVKGAPILRPSLIHNLALLTGPDRKLAEERAVLLWRQWDWHHRPRRAGDDEPMPTDEDGQVRIGRPRKAPGEHSVAIKISLPPELAAKLKADPDGPSAAVARMLAERAEAAPS